MSEPDIWTHVMNIVGIGVQSLHEIHRLLPDSILFGSIVLYILTQHLAFGVFGIFVFETILSHRFISWIFTQSVGSSPRSSEKRKCYAGFQTPQWKVDRIFQHENYPSYGVFSLTSIATYLLLATNEFTETLKAMGTDWSSRQLVAYTLCAVVLMTFILVRWSFGCESFGEISIAILLAILSGVLFFYINKHVFGVEGMNFLGLPYLVSKDSQGSPIYVCVADTTTP
jgi:hypothetical protein